jgi:transposase
VIGAATEADVAEEGVELIVVRHHEAKKGFVLLPRRLVVERTFGRLGRFRRLAQEPATPTAHTSKPRTRLPSPRCGSQPANINST